MSVTLSLNTPVPHTPIYDALLAERGAPLPEAESGDVTPVPPHTHVTEPYSRELVSIAERAAEAARAYGDEADSAASDIGRIHETTCADLRRIHHAAQLQLGLVRPENPQTYLDEIDKWDVARTHGISVDMVFSEPQVPERFLPIAQVTLAELSSEITKTEGTLVVAMDPSADDPEKTMVITQVPVDDVGHPVIFSVHGSATPQEPGETTFTLPPRYYEALRQLGEIEAKDPIPEGYEVTDEIMAEFADANERLLDGEPVDEFGSYLDEALKDPEFREAYNSAQGKGVIVDMLGLVCVDVTLEQVDAWTDEQRAEAVNWAGLMHLDASDNDVTVPPRPTFLPCDGSLYCTSTEHEDDCLGPLGQAETRFWVCPDHDKGIVEWDGDTAVCMEDGCKKTSETPREVEGA